MLQAKCIQKFKKNNQIYAYRLQDFQGNIKDVYSDQLKQAIKNQQIIIINLTLTSDNRLVSTTPTQQPQKSTTTQAKQSKISNEQIQNILAKAKLLNCLKEVPTACNHKCYLISMSDTQHIICIPDDITKLNHSAFEQVFTDNIKKLKGALKVVGGKHLKDASYMFDDCQAQSIDLSNFYTSKVTNMGGMFTLCKAQSLDLSRFDTSNVTYMGGMFQGCQAKSIDLSNFDTSKVTDMCYMFGSCQAQSLDLNNFDTSNVTDMEAMFRKCQAQSIDLSDFNTSKVTNMRSMFYGCQAQSIDLSSFDTSNVTDMSNMFYECKAKIKVNDTRLLNKIRSV